MSKSKNTIDRRSFLKVSSAAGGGMVLGFSIFMSGCKNDEVVKQLIPEIIMPDNWVTMSGFIKVGDNGIVTIMSPNPEIGQNVKTSMPMIIAEELDVDWNHVVVEQAPLDTEKYERQVAGGSQSIRHGWDALRKAGATTKAMLIAAAAAQWQVDDNTCTASKGIIKNSNGETLGYGEVASAAALLEVPEEVQLKESKDYKIIGESKRNVDLKGIITGKPLFGIDTREEGMMFANVLRPPAFGQTLKSYDDSAAKKVNGVSQVIKFGHKIAVIADSTWSAMKGKKALTAEWESPKDSPLESTSYHDEKMLALLDRKVEPVRNDGDVTKAFADADEVIERTYESPFLPHNCLEPMNFFAHVTDEKVYLKGPVQTPAWQQGRVAEILKRDPKDIEVHMTRMGGGFGRRLYGDFGDEAAEISSLAKVPIQLQFSREDDMTAGTYRVSLKYKIRAAIKDGKITGYHITEAASNSNMYGLIPNFFPAYAVDNYRVDNAKFDSNITTGAWRAPYTNFLAFAEQTFIDEVAEITKQDPVQMRLDLYNNAKKNKDDNMEWDADRMAGVLNLVVEKSNYGNAKKGIFQGLSVYYSHNTHVAEVAEVEIIDGTPKVTKVICAVDCGIVINPIAATNQIEGGIIDGIGHAMYGDFSFKDGKPSADNFHKYRLIRSADAPNIDVHFVDNGLSPTGLGEPSLPPAGGAVANALYKATGQRIYKQPFVKEVEILG